MADQTKRFRFYEMDWGYGESGGYRYGIWDHKKRNWTDEMFDHAVDAQERVDELNSSEEEKEPRLNPTPSEREKNQGRATWKMWHDKENPKREYTRKEKLLSEKHFVPIGKAHEILYSSDKWEKDGDAYDYIHEFESHPLVFIPASRVREDEAIGAPRKTTSVLGLRSPKKSLVVVELAKVKTLTYYDADGELVEIQGLKSAVLASSPDKKTLLILAKKGPILVRGGQMKVTSRGIVK